MLYAFRIVGGYHEDGNAGHAENTDGHVARDVLIAVEGEHVSLVQGDAGLRQIIGDGLAIGVLDGNAAAVSLNVYRLRRPCNGGDRLLRFRSRVIAAGQQTQRQQNDEYRKDRAANSVLHGDQQLLFSADPERDGRDKTRVIIRR